VHHANAKWQSARTDASKMPSRLVGAKNQQLLAAAVAVSASARRDIRYLPRVVSGDTMFPSGRSRSALA
jgi:hypothetical protein